MGQDEGWTSAWHRGPPALISREVGTAVGTDVGTAVGTEVGVGLGIGSHQVFGVVGRFPVCGFGLGEGYIETWLRKGYIAR